MPASDASASPRHRSAPHDDDCRFEDLCSQRHARSPERGDRRWGRSRGTIDKQSRKVEIVCPRVRLPPKLRRSLACTKAIENTHDTISLVTQNVKRWRDASMALRWAAAGILEAKAGVRRLKVYRQLVVLRRALAEHQPRRLEIQGSLARHGRAIHACDCPLVFRDLPNGRFLLGTSTGNI